MASTRGASPGRSRTRATTCPTRGAFNGDTLEFRDTGEHRRQVAHALHGDRRLEPHAARRRARAPASTGPTAPAGPAQRRPDAGAPMPSDCDDGPFGRGTGGRLRYRVRDPRRAARAHDLDRRRRLGPVARRRARRAPRPDRRPRGAAAGEDAPRARRSGDNTQLDLPGDRRLQDSIEWGKQNLADLTQAATDLEIRWTNEGKEWTSRAACPRVGWVGAGFPDYPWLFARRRRVHRARGRDARPVRADQGPHARDPRHLRDLLSDGSGVVVHEVVADGSVWYGKDSRHTNPDGGVSYDFNTDEIVKFPAAVALVWRWTGDDAFRDEMLDFTRRNLEYVRDAARRRRRRLARGQRQRRAPRHGARRSSTTPSTTSAACTTSPTWRASAGRADRADDAEARADELAEPVRGRLVDRGRPAVRATR